MDRSVLERGRLGERGHRLLVPSVHPGVHRGELALEGADAGWHHAIMMLLDGVGPQAEAGQAGGDGLAVAPGHRACRRPEDRTSQGLDAMSGGVESRRGISTTFWQSTMIR